MSFLWPQALWLLAVLPFLIAGYVWSLRRKKQFALRYSNLSLVREAMGRTSAKRHVPPALFLAALALMLLAGARPAAVVTLPSQHETVILAIDVSGSMRASDVAPTRLAAAQAAAKAFIAETPRSTRVGIVAFAGSASIVQPPTSDRSALFAALEAFQLQHATAIGSGILVSLKAIFPELEFDPFTYALKPAAAVPAAAGGTAPVQPGSYGAAAVILLTDGRNTAGTIEPIVAAKAAQALNIKIYTIGVGGQGKKVPIPVETARGGVGDSAGMSHTAFPIVWATWSGKTTKAMKLNERASRVASE